MAWLEAQRWEDVVRKAQETVSKPEPPQTDMAVPVTPKGPRKGPNLVELAHAQYYGSGSEARVLEG